MKNNNQKILRLLAKREYQENKRRNRILIGTVAFAVWMIFCVFSLAIGKIQADYLLMVRNGGTKATQHWRIHRKNSIGKYRNWHISDLQEWKRILLPQTLFCVQC